MSTGLARVLSLKGEILIIVSFILNLLLSNKKIMGKNYYFRIIFWLIMFPVLQRWTASGQRLPSGASGLSHRFHFLFSFSGSSKTGELPDTLCLMIYTAYKNNLPVGLTNVYGRRSAVTYLTCCWHDRFLVTSEWLRMQYIFTACRTALLLWIYVLYIRYAFPVQLKTSHCNWFMKYSFIT